MPDERIGRLARVALAEVDDLDAACRCLSLRLFEPHERVGRLLGENGGERHARTLAGLSLLHNVVVTKHQPDPLPGAEPERGFAVACLLPSQEASELAELHALARTAGVDTVGELVQHRPKPDPRTYVGKGKLEELKSAYADARAEVLVVDGELAPAQQRRLEDALETRVIDRTQLILDIFAQHAVSAEGKLQVELAQLEYNLPRMRGLWKHLERLGGGVGTRGPGESQLETDRRLARRRISLLKDRLRELSKRREQRRKSRVRSQTPTIALAGYTNVGKSTLLNALTGAEASIDDRLFETLDPTTRSFEHEGRRYLLTDTVGFIRRLPHELVEGFAATLEETLIADLVLHVADASADDAELDQMVQAVESVLTEIGAGELPIELVLNKIDRVDGETRERLEDRFPGSIQVSAEIRRGPRGPPRSSRRAVRGPVPGRGAPGAVRAGRRRLVPLRARTADRAPRGSRRRCLHPRTAARAGVAAPGAVPGSRRRCCFVIELPVTRLRDEASLPQGAYPGDAGLDLVACERVELGPGERCVVPTGIAVAIPEGYAGLVIPRSGLALEHGISLVNTPGLIDSGYRGELRVIALNTDRERPFTVEAGMRIAQLVVTPVPEVDVVVHDELPETVRGAAGFGSSGT